MKQFFYLLFIPLFMGLVACSDDSDDSNSKLTSAQRKFVGFWHCNNERIDFMFNADGTCQSFSQTVYQDTENHSGYWTYDEKTKVLSTTIGSYQWNVTLSMDEAWSGVSLNGNGTRSYVRSDLYHLWCVYLSTSKWMKKDGTDYMDFTLRNYVNNFEDAVRLEDAWGHDVLSSQLFEFVFDDGFKQGLLEEYSDIIDGIGLREESFTTRRARMIITDCKHENGQFVANVTQEVEYYIWQEEEGYGLIFYNDNCVFSINVTMTLNNPDSNDATLLLESKDGSFVAEYVRVK